MSPSMPARSLSDEGSWLLNKITELEKKLGTSSGKICEQIERNEVAIEKLEKANLDVWEHLGSTDGELDILTQELSELKSDQKLLGTQNLDYMIKQDLAEKEIAELKEQDKVLNSFINDNGAWLENIEEVLQEHINFHRVNCMEGGAIDRETQQQLDKLGGDNKSEGSTNLLVKCPKCNYQWLLKNGDDNEKLH